MYTDIVEKTREYIFNGDIFQAVQSRQFTSPYADSLLSAMSVYCSSVTLQVNCGFAVTLSGGSGV